MSQVFLSYRQTDDEQRKRVRDFGERLRRCGIDIVLDQFSWTTRWPSLRMLTEINPLKLLMKPGTPATMLWQHSCFPLLARFSTIKSSPQRMENNDQRSRSSAEEPRKPT